MSGSTFGEAVTVILKKINHGVDMARAEDMYQCQTVDCGYVYDPDRGDKRRKISPGTTFDDLSDEWRCPSCGAGKKLFRPLAGPGSVVDEQS